MSNQVDMFKFYASQLNLTKPQLEAVTDCFKACFEAEANGVENINPKVQDETTPSEKRQPHVPFSESDHLHTFPENDMANLFKTNNARLARAMNAKTSVPQVNAKDQKRIMDYGKNTAGGNYSNTVNMEEKRQADIAAQRQKVMNLQRELNKALGINLAVDGIKGPQTIAAEKRYKAMMAGNQQYSNEQANAARAKYAGTPEPIRSNTNWQKQSPDNGPRYYGDAPDPRALATTAKTNWGQANMSGTPTRPAQPSAGDAAGEQKEGLAQKYWEANQKYNPVSPRHLKEAWDWWTK